MHEIQIRYNGKRIKGKVVSFKSSSGYFIDPDLFEYEVDIKSTPLENIPNGMTHCTVKRAIKDKDKPIALKPYGRVCESTGKMLLSADGRKQYEETKNGIQKLQATIINKERDVPPTFHKYVRKSDGKKCNWLECIIDEHRHPDAYKSETQKVGEKDIYELAELYLTKMQFSTDHTRGFRVLIRAVARYEGFIRSTDRKRKDFSFDVHKIGKDTVEGFMDYLRNEKELSEQYPKLYERLLASYPSNVKAGYHSIMGRGENATIKLMKKLKAFFHWLVDEGITDNRPFEGVKLGSEQFGTPYYITIEERNTIAETPMPTKHLETQRDIFIFQCFVGCRVGDLVKLTKDNITAGVLEYTPHKTKDEGEQSRNARIPLHPTALALLAKYEGVDKNGRLFPFISDQKYNEAIKQVFTKAGITRNVIVRNALTGENEIRPINEVASSHLARRTFIGNAYKKVSDPNIIGRMSGHTEGSRAFSRYRNIEDSTLINVINQL